MCDIIIRVNLERNDKLDFKCLSDKRHLRAHQICCSKAWERDDICSYKYEWVFQQEQSHV